MILKSESELFKRIVDENVPSGVKRNILTFLYGEKHMEEKSSISNDQNQKDTPKSWKPFNIFLSCLFLTLSYILITLPITTVIKI